MKLTPANIAIIKRLLVGRNSRPLRSILNKLEPADLASLATRLRQRELRLFFDALMSLDKAQETLFELPEAKLEEIFGMLDEKQVQNILVYSSPEEAAYFLSPFFENDRHKVFLDYIDPQKQQKVMQFLNYPEESAGRMMQAYSFSLPSTMTVEEGLGTLRNRAQTESIYYIYCIDSEGRLEGIVSLRQLATAPVTLTLDRLVKRDIISVPPEASAESVAQLVSKYDFIALPVVNSDNKLLGIITVDDVVDIIQEQATASIYAQAGLNEDERVYTTPLKSIRNRSPWMLLNLLLAALASSVVSLFENTMQELIVLASVKNIVAGLGGNTAIQSLTVVTRGLATGDFGFISYGKALVKELIVGCAIGLMTGLGAAILTFFWKGDLLVSCVIFISMVINSLIASAAGTLVPMLLQHFKWDPATGSGVVVTMITDIFSFFSFLGLATLGLRLVGHL